MTELSELIVRLYKIGHWLLGAYMNDKARDVWEAADKLKSLADTAKPIGEPNDD